MKKLFGIILCLCMLLGLMSVTAFAAATDISVTSAAYHDNGDVKTIGIRFGWSSASATSRLAVMTSRLRSAGEAGTHGTYGDFTDMGYYGKMFNSWNAVIAQENSFGILYYTDEQRMQSNGANSITLNFDEGDISMDLDKIYYVYLWTFYRGQYYPDNLFMVLKVKDGELHYASAKDRNDYGSFTVLKSVNLTTPGSSGSSGNAGNTDNTENTGSSSNSDSSSTQSSSNIPQTDKSNNSQSNTELSVNEFEWEVLRLCNIERAKEGLNSLRMIDPLQSACDIRVKELESFYSHTRPTRQDYKSAIPYGFEWKKSAENIANAKKTPEEVVTAWMSDKTQKANILNPEFDYIGIGYNENKNYWVQIFADSTSEISEISINDTAKGIREYTENELLELTVTVTADNGYISHMPLSYYSMKKDGEYLCPRLEADSLPKFRNTGDEIPDSYYHEFQEKPKETPPVQTEPEPDNLFERYIPIAHVYSTQMLNIIGYAPGQIRTFPIGTRLLDMTKDDDKEYKSSTSGTTIYRNKYVGYYVKFNYLGTYGEQKASFIDLYLDILGEGDYYQVMNGEESDQAQLMNITKDTIVVSVDLYDQDKDYIRHLYPACIILAADEEGSFITLSAYSSPAMNYAYTRLTDDPIAVLFSQKNDYFAPDIDAGEGALEIDFKVREVGFTDKSKVEKLLSSTFKKTQPNKEESKPAVPSDSNPNSSDTSTNTTTNTTANKVTVNSPKATYDQLSVNEFEWEVLRLCNIERAKAGLNALSMIGTLQSCCDIREKELVTNPDHTRPNGEAWYTVIPDDFEWTTQGENVAGGQRTPAEVVNAWMNSAGHRENILNPEYGYMGVGYNSNGNYWVQIFSSIKGIKNVTTNAPSTYVPESEITKYYIAVQTSDGYLSYLPCDYGSMKQNGDKYYPRLNANNLPEFTKNQKNETPASVTSAFADVAANVWYAQAVNWAVEKGITAGTTPTTFSPDNTCTRAQIITFLWRAVGSPKLDGFNQFTDVKESDYFYDAALWASNKGMVSGTTFAPNTPCTRSATVVYLWKNAGSPSVSYKGNFTDVPGTSEYATAVAWAVEKGITTGTTPTTFSPDTTCTRAQIVTFLQRALT